MALTGALFAGCGSRPTAPASVSGDVAFRELATAILEDRYRRHPSEATDLGIHRYDDRLDDRSRDAIAAESTALKDFRLRLLAIDPNGLTQANVLDREQLLHAMDEGVLRLDTIRMWAKDPDAYSGGVTSAAYVIMKRAYRPAADRLKALIAREKQMPAALDLARANLTSPVRIYTEIAIEQLDGNVSFFKNDVPLAFKDVTDPALLSDFRQANDGVIRALEAYKRFLQDDVLPRTTNDFAYGADTYATALVVSENIGLPLARLMDIAESDRQRNEEAFQATAKIIEPTKSADQLLSAMQNDHPAPDKLLQTTQDALDSIREFIVERRILTIPPSDPLRVKETPPFMRSTTSASMDTPGPFESARLQAFYNMTLPDPRRPPREQQEHMRQWYYAAITNVSVHEVYPGHYIQFLHAKGFPSDVRKVFGANSNSEGWAHYCEQMMLDEGFHADDPRYRLAQLQDALLRDVRFIVGIKMHTQGMSLDEATRLFETAAHQPHPVAVQEAKRGTADALYGYYTMGKLMILKLREDYRAKTGSAYSLQRFHDEFIRMGPLSLPLVRRAMLGEIGALL